MPFRALSLRFIVKWGAGFLKIYQECLEKELGKRGIPFQSQQELVLRYKGEVLKQSYRPDLVCYEKIIVELKALRELTGEHRSQVLNYLKATGLRLGLLVNFGSNQKAVVERIIL